MQTIAHSSFKKVAAVYRHKVKEIFEIHYLGGMVKTTADHSVFVRKHGRILPIATRDIKKGDVLVELPLNIRQPYIPGLRQRHKIVAHQFAGATSVYLDFWNDDQEVLKKYEFALDQKGMMSQYAIASNIGVSQSTIGNWQNQVHKPQLLSKKLVKLDLPSTVRVTTNLLKLFGYYTAEGRGTTNLEFTFGTGETDIHQEVVSLMKEVFRVSPVLEKTADNTIKIKYYSAHLGRFFAIYCGNGSHNKHVPEFIWNLPKEHFLTYLDGYSRGDGYQTKSGKLSMTSVSKQLILELSWLCSMHGLKVGLKHGKNIGGRVIKNKPLPESEYWSLIIGKTANPFLREKVESPFQFKRAIVQKVIKKSYDGYVYDLCGVDNEAFFGGQKPVLLHNSRVRDLFDTAKKNSPSIIFIDEIDSIGRQRGLGLGGGHDEREQTLNQILVEMDGFEPNLGCIVVGATNRPDMLDPALIRPGRFDRRVSLDLPDIEGRKAIIKIHSKNKPLSSDVDTDRLARRTVGFSGADIESMLNEAAIFAARRGSKEITSSDLEEAALKVQLGPEKKRLQSEEDRRMTAYHEAGHALVTNKLPQMDPVHRVSIVARGMSLGHTMIPPVVDRYNETETRLRQMVVSLLGGRAAEEIALKEFTVGAANDIEKATQIARKMVTQFGMSRLGPMSLGLREETPWIARELTEVKGYSEEMSAKIDEEVKRIIDEAFGRAKEILTKNRTTLDLLASELMKRETLEGPDFEELVRKSESTRQKSGKKRASARKAIPAEAQS